MGVKTVNKIRPAGGAKINIFDEVQSDTEIKANSLKYLRIYFKNKSKKTKSNRG